MPANADMKSYFVQFSFKIIYAKIPLFANYDKKITNVQIGAIKIILYVSEILDNLTLKNVKFIPIIKNEINLLIFF